MKKAIVILAVLFLCAFALAGFADTGNPFVGAWHAYTADRWDFNLVFHADGQLTGDIPMLSISIEGNYTVNGDQADAYLGELLGKVVFSLSADNTMSGRELTFTKVSDIDDVNHSNSELSPDLDMARKSHFYHRDLNGVFVKSLYPSHTDTGEPIEIESIQSTVLFDNLESGVITSIDIRADYLQVKEVERISFYIGDQGFSFKMQKNGTSFQGNAGNIYRDFLNAISETDNITIMFSGTLVDGDIYLCTIEDNRDFVSQLKELAVLLNEARLWPSQANLSRVDEEWEASILRLSLSGSWEGYYGKKLYDLEIWETGQVILAAQKSYHIYGGYYSVENNKVKINFGYNGIEYFRILSNGSLYPESAGGGLTKIATNDASDDAKQSGTATIDRVPDIINQAEYLLYKNIFQNGYAGQYVNKETTKQGVYTKIRDAYNNVERYYVWGYLDNTRCYDWQWEFKPTDVQSLPAPGSIVLVSGTFTASADALDDYWITNPQVETLSVYTGEACELNMYTMSGTLERVQMYNIIGRPEAFEGIQFLAYGRVASQTLLEDPYYNGSWQVSFKAEEISLPAFGTTVLVQGTVRDGVLNVSSLKTLN